MRANVLAQVILVKTYIVPVQIIDYTMNVLVVYTRK